MHHVSIFVNKTILMQQELELDPERDTPHAHIYCTFPAVHNCAPEDGLT